MDSGSNGLKLGPRANAIYKDWLKYYPELAPSWLADAEKCARHENYEIVTWSFLAAAFIRGGGRIEQYGDR